MINSKITDLALESILYEVVLSPKPGLVDAIDVGSHKDMDVYTFIKSAVSLKSGFDEFYSIGINHQGTPEELMKKARQVGMKSEDEMFKATSKVNTHKGIVFSMGILLAAIGYYLSVIKDIKSEGDFFTSYDTTQVFEIIKEMTKGIVSNDFKNLGEKKNLTNGEKLYLKYGFTGIRGEAEKGYPILRDFALPWLRQANKNLALEDLLLELLIIIMSISEDSNIVARGGIDALDYVQKTSKEFLQSGGMENSEAKITLEKMNDEFKIRNISPGGSADLLSLAIFIGKLEGLID